MPRSSVVLPDRVSPKAIRCWSRTPSSRKAGSIVSWRSPNGSSSGSSNASGSSSGEKSVGSSRIGAAAGPCQLADGTRRQRLDRLADGLVVGVVQHRQRDLGEQAAPRSAAGPGWSARMVADSLRPIIESVGSFSRSSSRVPISGWCAIRSSFQRVMASTTWMPKLPPRCSSVDQAVLELLEVGAQLAEAVDQQARRRPRPARGSGRRRARPAACAASRCRGRGTPAPESASMPSSSSSSRSSRSRCERVATPPTCGKPSIRSSPPPVRSMP